MRSPQRALLVRDGPVAGLRFELREGLTTVGRSIQADCPLHDEAISRTPLRARGHAQRGRAPRPRQRQRHARQRTAGRAGLPSQWRSHRGGQQHARVSRSRGAVDGAARFAGPRYPAGTTRLAAGSRDRPSRSAGAGAPRGDRRSQPAGAAAHRRGDLRTRRGRAGRGPSRTRICTADFLAAQRDYPTTGRCGMPSPRHRPPPARSSSSPWRASSRIGATSPRPAASSSRGYPRGLLRPHGPGEVAEEIDQKEAHPLASSHPPIPVIRRLRSRASSRERPRPTMTAPSSCATRLTPCSAPTPRPPIRNTASTEVACPGGEYGARAPGWPGELAKSPIRRNSANPCEVRPEKTVRKDARVTGR